jgi:hypothetical protein
MVDRGLTSLGAIVEVAAYSVGALGDRVGGLCEVPRRLSTELRLPFTQRASAGLGRRRRLGDRYRPRSADATRSVTGNNPRLRIPAVRRTASTSGPRCPMARARRDRGAAHDAFIELPRRASALTAATGQSRRRKPVFLAGCHPLILAEQIGGHRSG